MKKFTFFVAFVLALFSATTFAGNITLPFSEDFGSMTSGGHESSSSTFSTIYASDFSWMASCSTVRDAGGMVLLGSGSNIGSFTTEPITATKDSVIVEFDAAGWDSKNENRAATVTYGTQNKAFTLTKAEFPITDAKFKHFRMAFKAETDAALTIKSDDKSTRFFVNSLSISEKIGVAIVTDKKTLNFGEVKIGESAMLELTITPQHIEQTIEWMIADDFTLNGASEMGEIEDYENPTTVQIVFSPTKEGEVNEILYLIAGTIEAEVELIGIGASTEPQIIVGGIENEQLDFDITEVGSVLTKNITITTKNMDGMINWTIESEGDAAFSISEATFGTCGNGDILTVTFAPKVEKEFYEVLTFSYESLEVPVALVGMAVEPDPEPEAIANPNPLNFGAVKVGTTKTSSITITTKHVTSDMAWWFTNVSSSISSGDGWGYMDAKGGTIEVTFAPKSVGTFKNTIQLQYETEMLDIEIEGKGVDYETGVENVEMSTIFAQNGRVCGHGDAHIFDLLGKDVTRENGNLKGVYIVKTANFVQKIVVE